MIVYPTNRPVLLPRARVALLAIAMLALAACSSGGSSGGGNTAPTANAGTDRTVAELTNVSLNGSGFDANGDTLTYSWTQIAGTAVTINNNTMAQANFDAFDVPAGAPETLSFELVVSDGTANATDVVDITIEEPAAMVAVSGTVGYEFVPPKPNCWGLDFDVTVVRPIRGATVQLLDAGGVVIGTTVSDDNGGYAFADVDANTMVRLRVRAELKKTTGQSRWDVDVRDNVDTSGNPPDLDARPLYVLDEATFDTGSLSVLAHDLTAATGWDIDGNSNSYISARSAAPFAILDSIYTVIKFVESADPDAFFAPLDAFWSIDNTATVNGDIDLGELGTSFYRGDIDSLFLVGDATDDTDEFDDHVIVHEWGHYFEDNFSRSDSFGGAHGVGDRLDARLAFGEGWATALSGMALGDLYCDTGVPGTSAGFGIGTESGSWDGRGWYDEISVLRFIYDMWDDNDDGGGADTVSIGFTPIYDVMTGPQSTTEAFTTIFSFATEVRAILNSGDQMGLDAQLAREDMTAVGLDLDIWGTNEANLADGAPDVNPIYTDITADSTVLNICVNDQFDRSSDTDGNRDRYGNKLSEDRFLRISVPITDKYDVAMITTTVTPVTPDPDDRDQSDPDIYIFRGAQFIWAGTSPDENSETFRTPTLQAGQTYIAAIEEWRFDDFEASPTYPERICFDISFSPTP